jgi:serpin B
MSQRALRTILVSTALAACDAPAAQPTPSRAQAKPEPVVTRPTPPRLEPEPEPEPEPTPAPVSPAVAAAVTRSLNAVSVDLHRAVARQPGNLFTSGTGVALALALVHAGSGGATRKQLAAALHLEKLADGDWQAGLTALRAGWDKPRKGATLAVANRLFGEQTLVYKPAYLELGRTVFGAPLEPVDFIKDPGAATTRINAWVGEQTRGKITDLVAPGGLDTSTRLVLTNAVYFKGDWQEPFELAATRSQTFLGASGKQQVPMMRSSQRLRLATPKGAKLRVLELPYAGGDYSLVIVLPQAKDGLGKLEKKLAAADLQAWIDGASETLVDLQLPRFTLAHSVDLEPVLDRLGLEDLFKPRRANLSGISEVKLALSGALHRTFVAVDEKGTEAAAATAITLKIESADRATPFVADHPFLFLIRDTRSGLFLFLGRFSEPVTGTSS